MNAQLKNWANFCQYHAVGDWYGTWTKYSPKGAIIESFQCIRSLQANEDCSEIDHQNHYTYADGKKETKTFGPYKKPNTVSLFLDNSFSWGSTKVESGSSFRFETGFRHENRRTSVAVIYDDSGSLQGITVITEHLESCAEESSHSPANQLSGNWQGTLKTMTPNWIESSLFATRWQRLEDLEKDYLTLNFCDGISLSCPEQIASENKFFVAVDWRVDSALWRSIRHYEASGFIGFTLELFKCYD